MPAEQVVPGTSTEKRSVHQGAPFFIDDAYGLRPTLRALILASEAKQSRVNTRIIRALALDCFGFASQ